MTCFDKVLFKDLKYAKLFFLKKKKLRKIHNWTFSWIRLSKMFSFKCTKHCWKIKRIKTLSLEKFCMVFKTLKRVSSNLIISYIDPPRIFYSACLYNCFFLTSDQNFGSAQSSDLLKWNYIILSHWKTFISRKEKRKMLVKNECVCEREWEEGRERHYQWG